MRPLARWAVLATWLLPATAAAQPFIVTLDIPPAGWESAIEEPPATWLYRPVDQETLGSLFGPELATPPRHPLLSTAATPPPTRAESRAIATASQQRHVDDPLGAAATLVALGVPLDIDRWCDAAVDVLGACDDRCAVLGGHAAILCDGATTAGDATDELIVYAAERTFRSQDRHEALEVLTGALERLTPHDRAWCQASEPYARTLRRLGELDTANARYAELAEHCAAVPDVHVKALYRQMRNALADGDAAQAVAWAEVIETTYPSRSHADDALFGRAEADGDWILHARDGIARYPDGDMVGQMILVAAERAGSPAEASAWLEEVIAGPWRDPAYQSAGRAELELARLTATAEDRARACQLLDLLGERYPYGYVSALADRLPAFEGCTVTVMAPPTDFRLTVEVRSAELAHDLGTAIAVRAYPAAIEILEELPGRSDDETWLLAGLHAVNGDVHASHQLTRYALWGWERSTPLDDGARWRIAYPEPFPDEVQAASETSGIPPSLIYAIMREESAFVPHVASHAGATGLMQVMPRTAEGHADAVEGDLTQERLFDPEVSIRLGADVLRGHWNAFPEDIPRIAASYNAGRGSTRRWDARHRRGDVVSWIEAIPYDETIHYVRRVTQSEWIYRWLGGPAP